MAAAIQRWPTTDLAELLGLIHTEIHRRADIEREKAQKRPRHKGEKP